jgi:hypothetical protein
MLSVGEPILPPEVATMWSAVSRFVARYAPVFVLFVLSPLLAEFVFGATPLSRAGGLVPVAFLYGGGAVLIRELARRRGPGWGRIALLGAAYAVVEEGLVLLSLFNPDLFEAGRLGARAFGVNWVWTVWTVGYHVVYSIVIPIVLTELFFPERAGGLWLGWKGMTALGVLAALAALAIGVAVRWVLAPHFPTPPVQALGAALVVAALVALALRRGGTRGGGRSDLRPEWVPAPWLLGLLALVAAGVWFVPLLGLPPELRSGPLAVVPVASEAAVAALAVAALRRWSGQTVAWTDLHRLALVIGALPPMMLVGFFGVTAGNRVDQVAQGVSSLTVLGSLAWFARTLQRRGREAPAGRPDAGPEAASTTAASEAGQGSG